MSQKAGLSEDYFDRLACLLENAGASDKTVLEKTLHEPPGEWLANLQTLRETQSVSVNGVWYHSRRDPQRESQRITQGLHDAEGVILLGAGAGHILPELLANPQIKYIIWLEPDAEMLFYFLNLYSPQKLFHSNSATLHLMHLPERENLENIIGILRGQNVNKLEIIPHMPSKKARPQKYAHLEEQIRGILEIRTINQTTIKKFQNIWNKNIILNAGAILQGGSLNDIIDACKDKYDNIVICGAGPSLHESVAAIKKYRSQILLICADTAFIPLAKAGVTPDIAIAADPQSVNRYFSYNENVKNSKWLVDPVVSYQMVHHLFQSGANVFWWNNVFYLDELIRKTFGDRGDIAHGGSVSTNAFDLAKKLNPKNIILIGQDLSYTNNLAHAKGAPLEEKTFHENNRFGGYEMLNFRQLKAHPLINVTPIKALNRPLYSTAKLKVFINWFEERAAAKAFQSGTVLYNSTHQGVLLKNFRHEPLENIIQGKTQPISVNCQSGKQYSGLNEYLGAVKKIIKETNELIVLYQKNLDNDKLLQKTRDPRSQKQLVLAMKKIDNSISGYDETNRILGLNAQSIILEITEENPSQASAQKLYSAMIKSGRELRYLLSKSVKELSSLALNQ